MSLSNNSSRLGGVQLPSMRRINLFAVVSSTKMKPPETIWRSVILSPSATFFPSSTTYMYIDFTQD